MGLEKIIPEGGASPRGHYTPAIRAGDFVYVSGQGPIDPVTDKLAAGDVEFQTRLTLANVQRILEAAGAAVTDVVKCSVFLRDIADFPKMNRVYAEFFGEHKPARTTIEAKFHQAEMLVEIDCVAYKPRL
jgi:2-iminobutanoate/2-iminopropanoate deaminase